MRRRRSKRSQAKVRYALAGGSVTMLAFIGFIANPSLQGTPPKDACQEVVRSQAVLTRRQLSQLLAIPERDSKAKVRDIVQEPYCKLSQLEVRAGVEADREAYPLEFDPQTWFVILYEGDEYAGYAFSFRR